MKIHQAGAELFHVDGQMDRWTYILKLTVAFHIFAIVPSDANFG